MVIICLSHSGSPTYQEGLLNHRVLETPVGNQCFGIKKKIGLLNSCVELHIYIYIDGSYKGIRVILRAPK